jgi:hypothetical protein
MATAFLVRHSVQPTSYHCQVALACQQILGQVTAEQVAVAELKVLQVLSFLVARVLYLTAAMVEMQFKISSNFEEKTQQAQRVQATAVAVAAAEPSKLVLEMEAAD